MVSPFRRPRGRALAIGALLVAAALGAPAFAPSANADTMAMPASAAPAPTATPDGHPTAVEKPFVDGIMADLTKRFPTAASAEAAGYLRYTDEDDTGAISYANRMWTSVDAKHPSQLWYDVKGRLLGADFSILKADSPSAPKLWGVDPARWGTFPAHVHLGLHAAGGTTTYLGVGPKTMAKGGGTVASPTKADLVKAGVAKSESQVAFVFPFPAIWDLTVWVLPNPDGAFADKNPDVHPVHPTKSD